MKRLTPFGSSKAIFSYMVAIAIVSVFSACQDDTLATLDSGTTVTVTETNTDTTSTDVNNSRVALAKLLARALQDPDVRSFLEAEADEQFNRDYDVLLALAKNRLVPGSGKSFLTHLNQIVGSVGVVDAVLEADPLVTLFEPQIPANASATQAPLVAIGTEYGNVAAYDGQGVLHTLSSGVIPTRPVWVLKTNERVVHGSAEQPLEQPAGRLIATTGSGSYYFANEAFDPTLVSSPFEYTIPQELIDVYKQLEGCNSCVFRDKLYYNIKSNDESGEFIDRYVETIPKLKMSGGNTYNAMGGWVEGAFEISIKLIHTEKDPTTEGYSIRLTYQEDVLSIQPDDLYTFAEGVAKSTKVYQLPNPIQYNAWDMLYWGNTSKFKLEEKDPGAIQEESITHTTNIGSNFRLEGERIVKDGISVGTDFSKSYRVSTSTTHITTQESDRLAETSFRWSRPVIRRAISNEDGQTDYEEVLLTTGTVSFPLVPLPK
jgi:hypothetical protein